MIPGGEEELKKIQLQYEKSAKRFSEKVDPLSLQ